MASFSCLGHVPCDHVLNTDGTQASATRTGKQSLGIFSALFPQPSLEYRYGGLGQRGTAFLAPLPVAMNMRASAQRNVFVTQGRHLGESQSGLHGGEEESVIATSQPSRRIRRRQQDIDFRPG